MIKRKKPVAKADDFLARYDHRVEKNDENEEGVNFNEILNT